MKSIITAALISFLTSFSFAGANLCVKNPIVGQKSFKNLSRHIESNPVKNTVLSAEKIKAGQKIATSGNEFTQLIFSRPYPVEFQIYPESEIEIISSSTSDCGPQIKLIKGKIRSQGNHVAVSDSATDKCPFEIETEEAYIQPTGTTYIAESGALVDAIAELNGETSSGNNLVGVGETGTIEESSYEKYSVSKGTIRIKLKKISKNRLKNPIKYSKFEGERKKKRNIAKNSKGKKRPSFLAYNEKLKLKAGTSMNVKRKKSMKKTQTAELEVIDPSGL